MRDFKIRDIALTIIGLLVAVVLTVWATYAAINHFLPRDTTDPLYKAGGLRPDQTTK
jgi:hypothetical protein